MVLSRVVPAQPGRNIDGDANVVPRRIAVAAKHVDATPLPVHAVSSRRKRAVVVLADACPPHGKTLAPERSKLEEIAEPARSPGGWSASAASQLRRDSLRLACANLGSRVVGKSETGLAQP